ncbi:hypothetical protein OROHE_015674 [Orobanche hederae]
MLNLIFAGKDTISAALTWFFWLLATNPAEEEKIRREMSSENLGGHNWKYSNMEELKKLVYLQAALCEALRLFPPVPFCRAGIGSVRIPRWCCRFTPWGGWSPYGGKIALSFGPGDGFRRWDQEG